MAQHLRALAQDLARWQSQKEALEPVLRRVLEHIWQQLPKARDWCRDRVYATGAMLKQLDPDQRHEAGADHELHEDPSYERLRWRRKLWSTSRSFPRRASSTSRGIKRCVSST